MQLPVLLLWIPVHYVWDALFVSQDVLLLLFKSRPAENTVLKCGNRHSKLKSS